jgi:cysteine desulfurase family protein
MDNAATSFPKPKAVFDAMAAFALHGGASAGRGAYAEAVECGQHIAETRRRLCQIFNGQREEHFVFTANCSEALNLAIKGLIDPATGGHAVCTCIDHNSVLRPLGEMVDRGWIRQTCVAADPITGLVDPEDIRRAVEPETRLIAMTHASNVTGTVQPLAAIGKIARDLEVPLVVDAAQSAGHVPIDVQADQIDLLAAPGHKSLLGPLGTGFLYIRPGLEQRLRPLKEGGTGSVSESDRQPDFMPDRFESGSHNAIGLFGLEAALSWIQDRGIPKLADHDRELVQAFLEGIDGVEGLHYFGPRGVRHRIGLFSVRIDDMSPLELAHTLERDWGILTRAGLHCAPRAHQLLGTIDTGGTTRLSFGPFLSSQDVRFAADALAEIAAASRRRPTPIRAASTGQVR